jgi:hypothetical protein
MLDQESTKNPRPVQKRDDWASRFPTALTADGSPCRRHVTRRGSTTDLAGAQQVEDVGDDQGEEHPDRQHQRGTAEDESPGGPGGAAWSCLAMSSAMPMIGVDRGAMIMAAITVAVESDSTPAVAR